MIKLDPVTTLFMLTIVLPIALAIGFSAGKLGSFSAWFSSWIETPEQQSKRHKRGM